MRKDVSMSVLSDIRKIARLTARSSRAVGRGVRATATTTTKASRWVGRNVGAARQVSGAGNVGMMRLLDLHAISCAGDTLTAIGLAGTIFFGASAGQARGRVALYLLVTMVPFALLAPIIGPLLDRFRHGRRYALAATMLGRSVLTFVIAVSIHGFALYPAAFGVLALSRAYGVARSAAVPRLLPQGVGLSQAGARASVYGTVAGAIVAPIGALAFLFGPEWPLRVAGLIFLVGAGISLYLPPKADSDPPERAPKILQVPWRHRADNGDRVLSGTLVITTLAGSAALRACYGFLLLFLAFAIRDNGFPHQLFGITLAPTVALALIGAMLAFGTFASTTVGTWLSIKRPVLLQAWGLGVVALAAIWASLRFSLASVLLFCLCTAIASGLAKLAVDASIQERIPETVRASAFAHTETLLMLAWVSGGAIGLIPFSGRVGVLIASAATVAGAVRAAIHAWRLRRDVLHGRSPLPAPTGLAALLAPTVTVVESTRRDPVPVTADEEAVPGYHVFKPSTSDNGPVDPWAKP
jgi:MFS family permease